MQVFTSQVLAALAIMLGLGILGAAASKAIQDWWTWREEDIDLQKYRRKKSGEQDGKVLPFKKVG